MKTLTAKEFLRIKEIVVDPDSYLEMDIVRIQATELVELLIEFASQKVEFPSDMDIDKSFLDAFNSYKWPEPRGKNRFKWLKEIWCYGAQWLRDNYSLKPDWEKELFDFITWYANKFEMTFTNGFKQKLIQEYKSKLERK